jgi:hypothetical protein
MRRTALTALVAVALVATALLTVSGTLSGPVRWTPDGLFYQARSLELRGTDREAALQRTFQGPVGSELRRIDPHRSGSPDWVSYSARFYERRVAVPAAAAVLAPVAGERAILDISIAGYVAAILAIFWLLLLRFRLPIAAGATLATTFLPALTFHAGFPLTDSWGLALETAALAFGVVALERGPRWAVPWAATIFVLALTRDSFWIPLLAVAWVAVRQATRVSWWLLATGVAAALPGLLLFSVPTRELLAMMLNGIQPAPDASWGFVAERYPGALIDLLQANGGFVRDGALYSAAYLLGGLLLLFLLARREQGATSTLLTAAAVVGIAYVLALPVFSAFRLELALVPMAAFGIALGAEWVSERVPAIGRTRVPATAAGGSGA